MTEVERVAILGHLAAAAMIWRSSPLPGKPRELPPEQVWLIGDMRVTIQVRALT